MGIPGIGSLLIIDDHEVVRDGIKRIVDEHAGGVVFGEASSPAEARERLSERRWDAAVLDLSLGSRSGLTLLAELRERCPRMPVLVLSMHAEEQYARRAFKAGAAGYVTKGSTRNELRDALAKVVRGGRHVSPALAEALASDLQRGADLLPHEILSDRELEVLQGIASGRTVGEIAGLLALSDKTISTYRARILEKMRMRTNAELTVYAIRNRLVD